MVWLLDNLYPIWVIVKNSFLAIGIVCESLWILFFIIQMQTFIADWLSVCLYLCPSVRKPACKNVWLGYIPSVIKRQHQKSTLISIGIGLWWYPWPPCLISATSHTTSWRWRFLWNICYYPYITICVFYGSVYGWWHSLVAVVLASDGTGGCCDHSWLSFSVSLVLRAPAVRMDRIAEWRTRFIVDICNTFP